MMVLVRCFHPMRKVRNDDVILAIWSRLRLRACQLGDTESLSWTLMSLPTTPLFFLIE
jgi:hypothetical protein